MTSKKPTSSTNITTTTTSKPSSPAIPQKGGWASIVNKNSKPVTVIPTTGTGTGTGITKSSSPQSQSQQAAGQGARAGSAAMGAVAPGAASQSAASASATTRTYQPINNFQTSEISSFLNTRLSQSLQHLSNKKNYYKPSNKNDWNVSVSGNKKNTGTTTTTITTGGPISGHHQNKGRLVVEGFDVLAELNKSH